MSSADDKLNILIAYPYFDSEIARMLHESGDRIRFVLDSGAFTAWKKGKAIALDDYCRFIEALPITPWRYFTLDVIGDPKASLINYETMLKRGFKPVPIFTRGENVSALDDYYKTSDVVGIGGLVGTQENKGFINGIMKRVGKRKVHWLGFAAPEYMKAYRPYMCDSSTWSTGVRYGEPALYTGNGKIIRYHKKHTAQAPSQQFIELFRKHGIAFMDLTRPEAWKNTSEDTAMKMVSFRAWVLFQRDVTRNLGTNFFLAIGSWQQLRSFVSADDWLRMRAA